MPSEYPVRIDRRVFVPAADGTTLALTTYLPDAPGDGPFPAVLESLPYRKDDDCTARDWQTFSYLAAFAANRAVLVDPDPPRTYMI